MKLARYKDRISLTMTEKEYIAAHRRFGYNAEALRATVSLVQEDSGKRWLDVRITSQPGAAAFWRQQGGKGDWAVQWKATPAFDSIPLFGSSEVGKFDPDADGVELIPIPAHLKAVGTDVGRHRNRGPSKTLPKVDAPQPAPEPVSSRTQTHVTLDQLREATAIIRAAQDDGFTPIFEDGRFVGFKAEVR